MKKILLINFGRMGDILQSSPLVSYLHEKYPGCKIGMMAAEGFKEVIAGIPGLDFLHPVELLEYMLPLRSDSLVRNYRLFQKLLRDLEKTGYDTVFNLTHNRLGAILSSATGTNVIGLKADNQGFTSVENPWMSQFYNTNINRGLNQFNLVDLYRLAGGFKPEDQSYDNSRLRFTIPDGDSAWAEEQLRKGGWDGRRKIAGFQAGASADAKRWIEAGFNTAARELADKYLPIFFGTEKERDLVGKCIIGVSGAIDFSGRTSVARLAALLKQCELLITNDTGTQHLAAAVGTKVLSLTIGPAYASETGPFGEGHIIIEPDIECMPCSYTNICDEHKCRPAIPPELVVWIAERMIEDGKIGDPPPEISGNVRISRIVFDDNALWAMEKLGKKEYNIRERVNIAYRKAWLDLLNSININDITTADRNGRVVAKEIDEIIPPLHELIEIAAQGERLSAELNRLTADVNNNYDRIRSLGTSLTRIDSSIQNVGSHNENLRPLTLYFSLGKEALPDAGLPVLAERTRKLYHRLRQGAMLFHNYLIDPGYHHKKLMQSPGLSPKKSVPKIIAIDSPYFASAEMIMGFRRAGIKVEVAGLDQEARRDPRAGEIFIHKLLSQLKTTRPDFLFTVNHLGFDAEGYLLKELESLGIESVVYYVDSPLFILDEPEKLASDAATIFCWDSYYLDKFREFGFKNVEYLPLAADETIFRSYSDSEIPGKFKHGLVYAADSLENAIAEHESHLTEPMRDNLVGQKIAGDFTKNGKVVPEILESAAREFQFDSLSQRRHFLAMWMLKFYQPKRLEMLKILSALSLTLYGDDGWKNHLSESNVDLRDPVRYYDQLPKIYSGMKAGFNSTSFQMPNGVNQRVFDIPAAGGFILTDYREALTEIFDCEKDIAVYHSPEEAFELADYYLKKPELRQKMSALAQKKVLTGHTYKQRINTILDRMIRQPNIYTEHENSASDELSVGNAEKSTAMETPVEKRLRERFPETIDLPEDISVHSFNGRYLIIAPEKAAWVVTDKFGAEIITMLAEGSTVGDAADYVFRSNGYSPEDSVRKVMEVIESLNRQNFRTSSPIIHSDIDKRVRSLQLFLTRKCNLTCEHCYFSAGVAMQNELSTGQWKEIIGKFARLGAGSVVTLTGGEPLMRKDFFEIAGEAINQGLKVVLLSNGGLIRNRETASKIADVVDAVQISIDGTTAEVNDKIRGRGSFDGAVTAVKLLIEQKVNVEMTSVVLPENVDDLAGNLASFAASFGTGKLKCALTVANPKGRLEGKLNGKPESLVGKVLTAVGPQPWIRHGRFQPGNTVFGCELAASIVVNPDGKLGNCPYLNYSGPRSALIEDFAGSFTGDCSWHRNAMMTSEKCKSCDLRNFQCGGCQIFGECGEQTKMRSYYRMLEEK